MAKGKKRLMIVDGHALLHRAWHALPPLSTKDGTIISGAYGFTMILLKALKDLEPSHVAVTFDLAGPTFRHEEYEEYKATREKKPDELYQQVGYIEEILSAMDIPVYTAEGFEADDVIGTLTKQAQERDRELESVVVTGDLDTLQLVDRRTKVYTLRKGMSDTVVYDESAVRERYGLRPDQLRDYKALRGDPSDNIPGVKGIGEKTALELLRQFGDLDGLYQAIDRDSQKARDLKGSVRQKLVDHKDDALQAQDLCTIRRNLELPFSLKEAEFVAPTQEKVRPVFEKYQFMKLLTQLPEGEGSGED
ncbi:hypothetical protein AMJ57_05200, partial [Parcubacteria bacterium SG8_24]